MKKRLYQLVATVIAATITQTSLLPQTLPELPDEFKRVKMIVAVDKKSKAINVTLRFELDRLVIRPQKSGSDGKEFPYTEIDTAEYSYSRHARWKESLTSAVLLGVLTGGIGAVVGIPLFFLKKEKRHWLTLQTRDDITVLRLDKENYEAILTKFNAKGVKVKTVGETK